MKIRTLALVLALAGCATADGSLEERERAGLERQLAGRTAGEARRCVTAFQGTGLTVVDRRTVVYDAPGTLWVNRLRADCPSLRPGVTLVVEAQGSEYCQNDRIRAVEPGNRIPGPICFLGEFTPYRNRR